MNKLKFLSIIFAGSFLLIVYNLAFSRENESFVEIEILPINEKDGNCTRSYLNYFESKSYLFFCSLKIYFFNMLYLCLRCVTISLS